MMTHTNLVRISLLLILLVLLLIVFSNPQLNILAQEPIPTLQLDEGVTPEGEAPPDEADVEQAAVIERKVSAVGTTFTYQGRLTDNGKPADGVYDFEFRLFNAAGGGSQIGGVDLENDVQVDKGFFSVELDFGTQAFTGASRYLEIAVRPGPNTGVFTGLAPRRNLTPAPYAIYADRTSILSAPDGSPTSALRVDNNGQIQIPNGSDVSPTSGGYIVFGSEGVKNIAIDDNEIMARDNGVPNTLHLNHNGGDVRIGGDQVWLRDGDSDSLMTKQTDNEWRTPIFFIRYPDLGDNINYNTELSATDWECGIAGFAALNGDIQEHDAGNIMQLYTYVSGGTWRIRGDFRTHNNHETWTITLLCIDTIMARSENF